MTLFDYAVLTIAGFSIVLGVARGLVREVLALVTWVVAFVVAGVYGGDVASLLSKQIADENWRYMAAVVAVFFGVLVVMSVIAIIISRLVRNAGLGAEDRLFGGIFGLARGLLVVVSLVLLAGFTPLPRQPVWKDAMLAAPVEKLAVFARAWLPRDWAKYITYH
ncbi:MAG: CvpA family protein [Betaproteobacteria bacterium]|nr:CvpA family protein [Betaproteobacteria bacterium]